MRTSRALLLVAALAGCHDDDWLTYGWDDRRVLCSQSIDDLTQDAPVFMIEHLFGYAERTGSVALLHAHSPDVTIRTETIEKVLAAAERYHLELVTYRDLDPANPPRAGLALAFDDHAIDAWHAMAPMLDAHGAKVTFFITRWANTTEAESVKLAELAAAGHDIEAHSVNHKNATEYVEAHGLGAYMADEVMPSIDGLVASGYAPTSYAFPFSKSTDEINAAVLEHVARVRVGPRDCPY